MSAQTLSIETIPRRWSLVSTHAIRERSYLENKSLVEHRIEGLPVHLGLEFLFLVRQ